MMPALIALGGEELLKQPFAGLLVLITALTSGACSHAVRRTPVDQAFTQPKANSVTHQVDVDESRWWTRFEDAGLNGAISRALAFNRDLAVAASSIDAAEAQARIARAAELPQLDASFSRGRQRANYVGLPIPGLEDSVLTTNSTRVGLSMNLSWEPDFWGKVKSGKIAAAADVESARAELAAARLSLAGQTAKAWFAAIDAQRQAGVAQASLESYKISAEAARAGREAGMRSSLDLEMALAEASRAESNLERRRQLRDLALRQLEILMGGYPHGEHEIAEDLPASPREVPAGVNSAIVHRRPDLIAAEGNILAADARIAQSRADLRPSFWLTGTGGTATNTLQNVLSGNLGVWSLIAGVTQPILSMGRLKATVKQKEAQARGVAANYESAVLRAYGEVEIAIASDSYLARQETSLEEATKRALRAQTLAEEHYRGGLADITTLLTAQRAPLEAESAWLSARRARLDNRVDLYLALGGDFNTGTPLAQPSAARGEQP